MLSITYRHFMLSITYRPFMLSVVAPYKKLEFLKQSSLFQYVCWVYIIKQKCKQLFEYQHLPLLRDTWWSRF
jgi:hypothetical protein